ncbi:MAG: dihydrofolate reductase [Magnetospirillum sp. WYHS-4]
MMRVVLIAAVADNGVIGSRGSLPWRLPGDLKRFKALTLGRPVVMGRKTFVSIGKPLPGRLNIVITRDRSAAFDGVRLAHSLPEALAAAADSGAEEAMVIGGAEIYALALPLARRLELTEVAAAPEGDAFFPVFDRSEWREEAREVLPAAGPDSPAHAFVTLVRR